MSSLWANTDPDIWQQLDQDPFNYYNTWVRKDHLREYLSIRREREKGTADAVQQLAAAFSKFAQASSTRSKVQQGRSAANPLANELALNVKLDGVKLLESVRTSSTTCFYHFNR